jgi:hypothetical protein
MTPEESTTIRLMAESIISCIDGQKYDNAKILAESIIAECIVKTELKDIKLNEMPIKPVCPATAGENEKD